MKKKFKFLKAQALIEFMVFGSIMIFLLASIIANAVGSVVENRQKVNILKRVLRDSEAGGFRGMQASFVHVEDRIASGVSRYGEIDRSPLMFSGSAILSKWLFYTPDEDEKEKIKYTPYIINGKKYNIPALTEKGKDYSINLSSGFIGEDIEGIIGSGIGISSNETDIKERLLRENGKFCRKITRGAISFCLDCLERFDLKRIGVSPTQQEADNLSWQWLCIPPQEAYEQFKAQEEQPLFYDINGDLKIEKISMIQENEDGTYRIFYKAYSGASKNPNCVSEGFRSQSRILTKGEDISLAINEDNAKVNSKNIRKAQSRVKKRQQDMIERQYQIDREIDISNKMNIANNLLRCATFSKKQACHVVPTEEEGCCFAQSRSTKDCIDTSTNILYIRNFIRHDKGSFWQQEK